MSVIAVLQARMTSTRLPGKVLRPILGEPMLARQIERLRRARRIDRLVLATSADDSDQPVADLAVSLGCWVHRGALADVLERYAGALQAHGPADHVVRVTADCPLTDWNVVDAVIARHLESGADYTSNALDRTFPKGLDVEVVKAPLLLAAAAEARDLYEREHVTPFFYRRPERFRIEQVTQPEPLGDLRWTVDTPEDFAFVTRVYEALYPSRPDFDAADILALGWTRWDGTAPPPAP